MSASSKKKLRSDNESAKLTERQLAEQKEAKQVKLYTAAFAAVLALLIVVAAFAGVNSVIESSGTHQKNTVAATIGNHKVSNAELSYYYMDAVNNFYSNYGSYAYLYGIDTSAPLSQQVIDEESGKTWADNFIEQAAESARTVYALADAAASEGFKLSEEEKASLQAMSANLDTYASAYGYANTDDFIKAQYGNGTNKASYLEYYERNLLASAYQAHYQDSLTYSADEIAAASNADATKYNSYSFNQYNLSVSRFLTGGTTDENGATTYTDAERAAAAQAAEEAVSTLSAVSSVEELDAAIAALSVNEGTDARSTSLVNQNASSVNSYLREWVTDASRQAGDATVVPVTTTSTDENGAEVERVASYYVAVFNGVNTNETKLMNVRHILVSFEGETDDNGSYSDEAKAAAKAAAEEILNQWTTGEATENSFAALANEKSTDTGSSSNGGLYENVYPGQMVTAFNDWCFDASRKSGDTGIVETEYGYHIMYYVSQCDQTYRDYMITNDLRNEAMNSWFNNLVEKTPLVNGDTKYMNKDLVLAR